MRDEPRVFPNRLPVPDPVAARMALSEVRSLVRHGFGLVRGGIENVPVPPPVAALTGSVLRKVDSFAHHADALARTAVDEILGPSSREASGLLERLERAAEHHSLHVSGSAARAVLSQRAPARTPEAAGIAMRRLIDAGAVRPAGRAASIAVFATLLAELQPGSEVSALPACLSLADALSEDLEACRTDAQALARLFDEFRDHV